MNQYSSKLIEFILLLFAMSCLVGLVDLPAASAGQAGRAEIGTAPQPGLKSLGENGNMQISDADRCPVCAMKAAKYPKFSCAIQLTDGRTYYFCGTGCMIRAWLHPEVFLAARRQDIALVVVRDYFTGEQFDALTATWIAGSDVIGPMGPALIPIKDPSLVQVFLKRHGGKTTFRLRDMGDEKWRTITGKSAAP